MSVARTVSLIAIGASTGGTEAIRTVLGQLTGALPPIAIVQHMPESFTASFARRLDAAGAVRVKEAQDGERLLHGWAYLAPGGLHLSVERRGASHHARLGREAAVNLCRPAVDVLFHSVAAHAGAGALGVLLTGMGKDGAQGLLAMRRRGAHTIAQDQASCVVYGMPREAVACGAAVDVLALRDIAARLNALCGAALVSAASA